MQQSEACHKGFRRFLCQPKCRTGSRITLEARPLSHFSTYLFSDDDMHCMFDRMGTVLTDDPKHWRGRAHEARIRAGELNDPEAKRQMMAVARGYDRRAERRLRRTASPPEPSR